MADIEIVKVGLKYHRDSHKEGCVQGSQACPYIAKGDRCFHILLDDALSVINEQQAEIEYMKSERTDAIEEIEREISVREIDPVYKTFSRGIVNGLEMAMKIIKEKGR